jgi:mono/diheme cytochrome c family protein
VFAALVLFACQDQSRLPLAEQGRRAYQATCIACHNPDPARDGTLGPAVACSSAELIEARVMRAEYPPGYAPKRDSRLMPAQPYLRGDLPGLAAFLACP